MSFSLKNFFLIAALILISALTFTLCSCDWFSGKEETEFITEDIARSVLLDAIDSIKTYTDFKATLSYEDHDSYEDTDKAFYVFKTTGTDSSKIIYWECTGEYEDGGDMISFSYSYYFAPSGQNDNKYIAFYDSSWKNKSATNSKDDEEEKFYSYISQSDYKEYTESYSYMFFQKEIAQELTNTGTLISGKKVTTKKNTKYEIKVIGKYSENDPFTANFVIENGKLTLVSVEDDDSEMTYSYEYNISPLSWPDKKDYEYQADFY